MDMMLIESMYHKVYSGYPELLEVKDLCRMLGYERKKIYRLINEGQIKRIPCGRKIKVAKASVIEFVLQCAQK